MTDLQEAEAEARALLDACALGMIGTTEEYYAARDGFEVTCTQCRGPIEGRVYLVSLQFVGDPPRWRPACLSCAREMEPARMVLHRLMNFRGPTDESRSFWSSLKRRGPMAEVVFVGDDDRVIRTKELAALVSQSSARQVGLDLGINFQRITRHLHEHGYQVRERWEPKP